ncbi:MAG TPA: hypothetical protein VFK29_00570, partial [Rhodanobacteraceae bacterium]|nr:hypothetical protein [Rhodanobacteraceae bacterium]
MATTKAFNLGLLGIIELLLDGRSTDAQRDTHPCDAIRIRDAYSPPGGGTAKPLFIPSHATRRLTRRACGLPARRPQHRMDRANVNKCKYPVTLRRSNAFSAWTAT